MKNPKPSQLLQYGHGLFGSREEITQEYLSSTANDNDWILFGTDWFGMSRFDVLKVADILLAVPENFALIPHNVLQGFINNIIAGRFIKEYLSDDENLKVNGNSLIDKESPIAYYGNSQGGILGGKL